MKQFYDIKPILKTNSEYNMIIGQRSNGKSYAVKYISIYEAFNKKDFVTGERLTRYEIGYGRRWKDELKSGDIEKYFADVPIKEITKGKYDKIKKYKDDLFFYTTDKEGKDIKGEHVGNVFALTSCTHYKSLTYPKIRNYIFEEFITQMYLPKDVENLESIISTIARLDFIRVFLIGNTINRVCPYFREWELKNALTQKQGTIDIYKKPVTRFNYETNQFEEIEIKIALERCGEVEARGVMAFGQRAKSINGGEWECNVYPHLVGNLEEYKIFYKILYKYSDFKFIINLLRNNKTKESTIYVYPYTKQRSPIQRIVTDEYNTSRFCTAYLTPLTKYDKLIIDLINDGKVCFSDNLTGEEFYQIRKNKGGF